MEKSVNLFGLNYWNNKEEDIKYMIELMQSINYEDRRFYDCGIFNETLTKAICNKGFSGNSSILPRSNFCVGGHESSPQPLTAYSLNRCVKFLQRSNYEK
jgi:hypothetical protein